MSTTATTDDPATVDPLRSVLLRVLAALLLVGVVLQGLFAGGFLGGGWTTTAHEVGANATFGVALLQLGLVVATPSLRADRALLAGIVVIVVTLTAIIGLGYAARSSRGTLVAHVPLAVIVAIGASDHVRSAFRVAR